MNGSEPAATLGQELQTTDTPEADMFDKIIVGIDGSEGGRDAIRLAQQLGAETTEVVFANVFIESQLPARGSAGIFKGGSRRESTELLQAAAAQSAAKATLCPVPSPYVGRGLHELADQIAADLLVVGSAHRGRVGRVLLGDELRAALNGAPCAVAVAPAEYAERTAVLGEIGVGYDGSPGSVRALATARELAAEHGASVSVFEALSPPGRGFADPSHARPEALEAELDRVRERLAELGDVTPHTAYGTAGEELALYGASVDLLVVGSRDYGPLGRMMHGHTSLYLAHAARCPLLVLPRGRCDMSSDEAAAEAAAAER